MGMVEEFRKDDTACVLGDQEEPFYLYLASEVGRRGTDAIDEMERCVFDGKSTQYAVQLAMVWCGDSEDEGTVARRLSIVLRVLRDHPNSLARMAAARALHTMRPDMLDAVYAHETDSGVKYCIAEHVIDAELRSLVQSNLKYVMVAKGLLGSVYLRREPTSTRNQNVRKAGLVDAVKLFGVSKTAVLLHFICGHRFTTGDTRKIVSRIMQDCAPPELLDAFRARKTMA